MLRVPLGLAAHCLHAIPILPPGRFLDPTKPKPLHILFLSLEHSSLSSLISQHLLALLIMTAASSEKPFMICLSICLSLCLSALSLHSHSTRGFPFGLLTYLSLLGMHLYPSLTTTPKVARILSVFSYHDIESFWAWQHV